MLILVVIRNLLTALLSSPFTDSFVLITPCSLPARSVSGGAAVQRGRSEQRSKVKFCTSILFLLAFS